MAAVALVPSHCWPLPTSAGGSGRVGHPPSRFIAIPNHRLRPAAVVVAVGDARTAQGGTVRRLGRQRATARVAASGLQQPIGSSEPSAGPTDPSTSPAAKAPGSLQARFVYGALLAISGGGAVLAGGWVFAVALAALVHFSCREYFALVAAKDKLDGLQTPPVYVQHVTVALSCAIPITAQLYAGARIKLGMTVAAFGLLALLLLSQRRARFSQFTSTVFGLFYCGYLPSFWVKLRCIAADKAPVVVLSSWPPWLGGPPQWTVGLVATLAAVCCIIAADTGAYLGGKTMGRTQLIEISPKKTVEGAASGLLSAMLVAAAFATWLNWPATLLQATALGSVVFVASLFGDLFESTMKRDAGVKDSGQLIPGHGGVLDRFDSYMFTGALVYFLLIYIFGVPITA